MSLIGGIMNKYIALTLVVLFSSTVSSEAAVPTGILAPSYVHPDYIAMEQLRPTKDIIVITKKDIQENGYTSISEALTRQTGINVGLTGEGSIDIRGQGDQYADSNIQVLVDGVPITTLVNHPIHTNYDVVPIENIEKIEIIPGGGSVLYGSGTVGGVINITTNLRSVQRDQTTIGMRYQPGGYRMTGSIAIRPNARIRITGGYTKYRENLYFQDTWQGGNYYFTAVRYEPRIGTALTFRASHLDNQGQYIQLLQTRKIQQFGKDYKPGYRDLTVGVDTDGNKIVRKIRDYSIKDRVLNTYHMTYMAPLGKFWNMEIEGFTQNGNYANFELKKMEHQTQGGMLRLSRNAGNHKWLFGMEGTTQQAKLEYNDYPEDSKRPGKYLVEPLSFFYKKRLRSVFLMHTLQHHKWILTQGIRREVLHWDYDKKGAKGLAGKDSSKRYNTAAELSLAYQYTDTGSVFARYERAYTVPNGIQISDKVLDQNTYEPLYVTSSAQDEIYDSYELGWRAKLGASTMKASIFYNKTDNQLCRVDTLFGMQTETKNLLQTRRRGIELSLQQQMGKWKFFEGYTYVNGSTNYNEAGRKFLQAEPDSEINYAKSGLKKVPAHKVVLRSTYMPNRRMKINAMYRYVGAYKNYLNESKKGDAREGDLVHSYGVLDVSMSYQVQPTWAIYGGITNVFNKEYYEFKEGEGPYSTITHGANRTYYIGVNYTL